jgi:hypothetical protein
MGRMNSASSYVSAEIDATLAQQGEQQSQTAYAQAMAGCHALAVERTGGSDGLELVTANQVEQGGKPMLATSWTRNWEEPEPPAPAAAPEAEVKIEPTDEAATQA